MFSLICFLFNFCLISIPGKLLLNFLWEELEMSLLYKNCGKLKDLSCKHTVNCWIV